MSTMLSSRTILLWSLLTALSIGGIMFTIHYFPQVFPMVTINLTMDRDEALAKATQLAQTYNWGPSDYQQTALFAGNSAVQNFIELESGGPAAFQKFLQENDIAAYTWNVRHFKEAEKNETLIIFNADGTPYGFKQTLSQDKPGPVLKRPEAQQIAESFAQSDWNINFSDYNLVESSEEKQPNGRVDHEFVYEHTTKKINTTPYRLKLAVSGDTVTKLKKKIQVPESFLRRYEQMRSDNNLIALIANLVMAIIYILGCCFVGSYVLAGKEWLLWKKPLLWASIIVLLNILSAINSFPLYLMGYNTAIPLSGFIGQLILTLVAATFGFIPLLTIIIMAAESLTRKAFGHHPQLWKIWSKQGASSLQILGRTIGGYLLISLDLLFIIIFYWIMLKQFNWWSPSETFYNPNILATYLPWLTPFTEALTAGFVEECLFRAVPLATAALLGKKYGGRRWWILGAFIFQAIIFGAAHANYPAQPAYARLIELIIPSFIFGAIYLRYGLLPSIISHVIFDASLMGIPIFISHYSGSLLDKVIFITLCAVPLIIILIARLRSGSWSNLPEALYNRAYRPHIQQDPVHTPLPPQVSLNYQRSNYFLLLTLVGFLGIGSWFIINYQTIIPVTLHTDRATAQQRALKEITERGITLTDKWHILSTVEAPIEKPDFFIWRTARPSYRQLRDEGYLMSPAWHIRFAQFDGDVAQRAEEYHVVLTDNKVMRYQHIVPEDANGSSLSETEARQKIEEMLAKDFGISHRQFEEVSAVGIQKPHRKDWQFTVKLPDVVKLEKGYASFALELINGTLTDYLKTIFVPEEWLRTFDQENNQQGVIITLSLLILCALMFFCLLQGMRQWHNRHKFSRYMALLFSGLLFLKVILQAFNIWPVATFSFKTSLPYIHQVIGVISGWLVILIIKTIGVALTAGLSTNWRMNSPQIRFSARQRFIFGISTAGLFAWVVALQHYLIAQHMPISPDMSNAGAMYPAISYALNSWQAFVIQTLIALIFFLGIDKITHGWRTQKLIATTMFLMLGGALVGLQPTPSLLSMVIVGMATGLTLLIIYLTVLRFNRSIIPLSVATLFIMQAIQLALFYPYEGALLGSIVSSIMVGGCAWWWSSVLNS